MTKTTKKINNHNLAYFNNYKYYLKVEKGLSVNSIESYSHDVKEFLNFVLIDAEKIKSSEIINFFVSLQDIGLNSSSISRKRSSLKSFFGFLDEEEIELEVDFNDIPSIRSSHLIPDVLSKEEMEMILDSIETNTVLTIRNKAILELLYACGLRISELINLTIHDVYWEEKLVRISGKGRKQRIVPIASTSLIFLKKYNLSARNLLLKEKQNDVLFLNRFGNKLSRMGVWKIIDIIVRKNNIKKKVSPHTFRHSFATHLLEAGANLRVVQLLLGHASINTTQIYTNIDMRFIKTQHQKYHPRS
ncbi:MAG: tyrosine recombinase [Candidatus Cloacimonetes bacterium]|nr:tyrosine recombinase [Candidatus Cloacimonadota bacterium]